MSKYPKTRILDQLNLLFAYTSSSAGSVQNACLWKWRIHGDRTRHKKTKIIVEFLPEVEQGKIIILTMCNLTTHDCVN